MKESNANGDGKFLPLMGQDFEFYCLQVKNPVGIPNILILFLVGMRVQCSFPMGMKSQGIFLTGDRLSADFSYGQGTHWVCDMGCDTNILVYYNFPLRLEYQVHDDETYVNAFLFFGRMTGDVNSSFVRAHCTSPWIRIASSVFSGKR